MNFSTNQLACIQCHFSKGIGSVSFGKLVRFFEQPSDIVVADETAWRQAEVNGYKKLTKLTNDVSRLLFDGLLSWLNESSYHHLICYGDELYPTDFYQLVDPPAVIYVKGDLTALAQPLIAIVGSRQATPMGLKTAQRFAFELTQAGLGVVSGLAYGVDTQAHMGCLAAKGQTIALMGTGLDKVYPEKNKLLAKQIVESGGLLMSEFALGTAPRPQHFPTRNRLICGLSAAGVLVVESKGKSGSMITARLANEQGRNVYAIPSSIYNDVAVGCHRLIQQGAKLCVDVVDILEELSSLSLSSTDNNDNSQQSKQDYQSHKLSDVEHQVLATLGYEILRFDEIQLQASLTIAQLQEALFNLEVAGIIAGLSGNRWQVVVS